MEMRQYNKMITVMISQHPNIPYCSVSPLVPSDSFSVLHVHIKVICLSTKLWDNNVILTLKMLLTEGHMSLDIQRYI